MFTPEITTDTDINVTEVHTPWESEEGLSTYQMITFIWCVLCLIPNAITIVVLSKSVNRKSPLYFTLLNLSVSNLILILTSIYWTIVPLKYLNFTIWQCSYFFSMSFIALTVVLLTIFAFARNESFKFEYLIFRYWTIVIIFAVLTFVSIFVEYIRVALMLTSFGIINAICLMILLIKVALSCRKDAETEDSFSVRATIATVYTFVTVVHGCFVVLGFHWVPLFEWFKIVIFADGYLNLCLAMRFDESIKSGFLNLFKIKEASNPV